MSGPMGMISHLFSFTNSLNTIFIATIATFLIIIFSLLINYSSRIKNTKLNIFFKNFSSLGYAIPGSVIAIGVLIPFTFMDNILIIYPILPIVFLNFIVVFHMRYTIGKAIKKRDVEYKYFRAYEGSAPEYMLISRHHYKNFFEIPILFYLLCIVLYSINDVSTIDLWIAWLFVIFKFGHSYIRMTSNYVSYRAYLFYK